MRTLFIAAAFALFASLLGACGKAPGRATPVGAHGSLRSAADVDGNGAGGAASSPGTIRVPATWQDTRGFTPYEDYRPDQILAVFYDELSQSALDAPPGAGQPPIDYGSPICKSPAHAQFARALAAKYGMWVVECAEAYIPGFLFCTYQLPPDTDAEALMQRILDENPADVRLVEYNPVYHFTYTPNDPKVQDGTQWYHNAAHVDNYGAWDLEQGGDPSVWVAILDSGVDMDHPDLNDNILPINTMWPGVIFDLGQNDTWPDDNNNHGSHCAGIAAAEGDNTRGGAGVAYKCRILPIKLSNASGNFTGSTPTAIALAASCGASVISMSFGSFFPSEALKQACETAYEDGLVICAAAGNDNSASQTFYPAGIPVVIAVGASDESNNRAGFSSYGAHVDIAAPGTNIYSTIRGSYDTYQGTSMATPLVAGAAALVKSYFTGITNGQIRGLLELTGAPLDDGQWQNSYITRVDTAAALAGTPAEGPIVTIESPAYNSPVTGQFQIHCTVEHPGGGETQRALLYTDGYLIDELYGPGDDFTFDCDATDRFPAGMNVVVEIIDSNFMHAFANSNFIITDPHVFKGPYYESFDGNSADHWTARNFSGAAAWQLNLESAGPPPDYALRLGNPDLYNQDDSDWLFSPLFDLRNTQQAKLVFHAKYDVSQNKPMYMAIWSQTTSGFIGMFYNTGDDWYSYNLNSFCYREATQTPGQVIQFFWMLDGADAGGQRYIAFDDFNIVRPTALPTIGIDFPTEGLMLKGFVPITVAVNDDYPWQLDRCEIFANGALIATTHGPNWSTMLDTDLLPSGPLTLTATVYEDDGYDRDAIDDYSTDTDTMESVTTTRNAFIAHQSVTSFAPSSGFYNDEVTITGNGFGAYDAGTCTVLFAGASGLLAAPVTSWNDAEIICNVPVGAVTGKIRIDISGAWRDSPDEFIVYSPYDDFSYTYENAPPDLMFIDSFFIRIAAQPDMDSITVRVAGFPAKEWSVASLGNPSDTMMFIDMTGLGTGACMLELEGFVGAYSETIGGMFFMNPLPGDFNGNGVVDDPDTAYLLNYLELAGGAVPEGDPAFYPFLDVNDDGFVDEADAPFVGYYFGATL